MTTLLAALLAAAATAPAAPSASPDPATRPRIVTVDGVERIAGEYLVRTRRGVPGERAVAALQASGMTVVRELPRLGVTVVRLEPGAGAMRSPRALGQGDEIDVIEPNFVYRHQEPLLPDDPKFSSQWGLHNTGQSGGRADADIDAPEAWETRHDASAVVVAVVDSGVDIGHPDLAPDLWTNPGEVAGNGVDDDGNGYVDDVHGWNFVSGGPPQDDHRHGSHVSGIIGAAGNDRRGVAGVAWPSRIMACKFLDNFGTGTAENALRATAYAIDNGARVINNSWGGGGYSKLLEDLIREGEGKGVVYLAAAGNSSADNDAHPFYPANYKVGNVISVAALDRKQRLADFSNYGATTVHIGAPGKDILSTLPRNRNEYGELSGTSMATPFVSGVVALLLAQDPALTPAQVKERLARTADPAPSLAGKTIWGGRVNAANALADRPGTPLPGPEPGPGCSAPGIGSAGSAGSGSARSSPGALLAPLALVVALSRRRSS